MNNVVDYMRLVPFNLTRNTFDMYKDVDIYIQLQLGDMFIESSQTTTIKYIGEEFSALYAEKTA